MANLAFAMVLTAALSAAFLIAGATQASAAPYGTTGLTVAPSTKQAGGHPVLKQKLVFNAAQAGSDDLRSFELAHAPGMLQNLTLPKCVSTGTGSANKFKSDTCPSNSLVGTVSVKWRSSLGLTQTTSGRAYLLSQASTGAAGTIGVILRPSSSNKVFINVDVIWPSTSPLAPKGPVLKVVDIPNTFSVGSIPYAITISEINLDLAARGGGGSSGPYFTLNPSSCTAATSTANVTSWSGNTSTASSSFTPTGCSSQTLASTVSVARTTSQLGAPTGLTFGVTTPTADLSIQRAQIRNAQLRVDGAELVIGGSPATCALSDVNAGTCAAASKVGSVQAGIPFLGVTPTADVHLVAAPPSAQLAAALPGPGGSKFTILWSANNTGTVPSLQLLAENIPQLFSSSVKLTLDPGLIRNSITCSAPSAQTTLTSWHGSAATFNTSLGMAQTPCSIDTSLTASVGPGGSATFTISSPTSGASFECQLDSAAFAACQSPVTLTNLGAGQHTFCARAVLGYLADQSPACHAFVIEIPPPAVVITAPANNSHTTAPAVNVAYTVDGSTTIPAGVTCAVNGAFSGSTTTNPVSLAPGANAIVVTCTSSGGSSSAAVNVFRDTAPAVVITSPASDPTFTTAQNINIAFTINGATSIPAGTICTISGPGFSITSMTPSTNSVPLVLGTNVIVVSCETSAGLAGTDSVTVVTGDPVTTAGCTRSGSTATCTFQTSPTIPQTVFTCSLDGASPEPCTSPVVYTGLAVGVHNFQVCAINPFGAFCAATTIPHDTQTPTPVITSPASDPLYTSSATVNIAYVVNGMSSIPAGTTCVVTNTATGVSSPSASTATNPVALVAGSNLIRVECTNTTGTGTDSTTVIRGNPTFSANCTRDGSFVNCTFSVSGSSGPVSFSCSVNGAPATACTSPATFFVGTGPATVTICMTTPFGTDCRTFTFAPPVQPPLVTITSPAVDPLNTTNSAFNIAYTINGATTIPADTACTINSPSGTQTSTSTTTNSVPLIVGANLITVTCTNPYGSNADTTTIVRGVPPAVVITAPADPFSTTATSINVAYTVNGASTIPAGTACTVNGVVSTNPLSNFVALTPGAFTITVSCVNAFGVGSDTATRISEPPTLIITAPANNSQSTTSSVNVSYVINGGTTIPAGMTCQIQNTSSGTSQVSTSTSTNAVNLQLGTNLIRVTCSNAFGSTSATVVVNYSGGENWLVITNPTPDPTYTTASSVNLTYTIGGSSTIPAGTSCTVNGVASTSATSNTVNLAVGSNVITVSCTNANGTSSDTTTVVRGSVPVVTITSPSTNPFFTTATSINVAFVVNGGTTIPAGTTCAINGVPTTNTTTNNVALPSGPFTITVTCTNQFGSGSASVTKAIPTTPVVTIVSPAADPSSTGNPSINVAFTVNGSTTIPAGTMCSVNGVATTSTTTNSVSLVIGTNTILVTCTNSFGSGSDATTVVRSDSPPNFQITAPVNDSWTAAAQTNVAFTLSGSPSVPAGTTCTVNGTPTTSTTTNSVNLVEGVNTITVVCTNAWGTVSHTVTVNRDSVAPTISPLSLLSHGDPGSFLLQYTASDNSGFAPNCTPASGSIVTIHAGANTITVTCEDRAQNAATSTITFTSTSAFSVSITSGPPEEVYTPVVQFSYAASEQLSSPTPCADPTQPCVQVIVPRVRLDCSLDGGSWFSCPISTQYGGSYTTPSLMPGTHTFCVRGTRLADNAVDQDCSVFTVRGDPPPPSCSHSGSTVTCTLPSVPGTSYTCQLDGEAASNCSGTWIRSGIPSGAHQVRICATNASGSACSIYAFTVDNAQLTITSPVNGSSTTATGVTLTYTTTGFPAGTTCSPASGTRVPVSLGANTISVACTLPSGEVTAPASTSVTRTPLPGFTPTFEHSYDTNDVTGGIVLDFTIANPAGSNPVKTATITHPNEVWPNFNAYGSSASKCDGTIFLTPAPPRFVKHPSCPDVAKVGTVTLSSPDFPSDLHGEIWIVNRGGLPWFGVDFSSASLGNPSSVPTPNMVIQHSSVDDLECDSDIDPSCMSLTQLTVTGFPDATALSAQFHLGSHQDRIDPNGQLLPSEMFRWEVLACDTAYTRATLGSVNNETATVNGPIFLPPSC